MPMTYERDDARRLITVTVTEPYTVEEICGAIDRQAAENTWDYAMLYDLRSGAHIATEADLQQLAVRAKVAGGGRERGPVGLAIAAQFAIAAQSRWGLLYTEPIRQLVSVEVLLTAAQLDGWLDRNARPRRA
jgi:hypothetical protein